MLVAPQCHIQNLSNCCRHKYDHSIWRIFRMYFLVGFCNLSWMYTTSRHYWHHPTMHCAIRTRSMNFKSDLKSWLLDFCLLLYQKWLARQVRWDFQFFFSFLRDVLTNFLMYNFEIWRLSDFSISDLPRFLSTGTGGY